jgi:hypothetical protein
LIVKALTFMALCWATGLGSAAMELDGKVVCGYQGWFRTPDDGSDNGWHHYTQGNTIAPGHCGIDLWPDVRELPEADRVATLFRHPDGSPAQVFSSVRPSTAALHFQWMQDYGIDGIFLQRFAVTLKDPRYAKPMDQVLRSCQENAAQTKRGWALMYDLSGASKTDFALLQRDWTRLRTEEGITDAKKNPTYFHHRKKPVIGLWGLGFNDRDPMLKEWRDLLTFFKAPENGGCSIVLGVPAWWRTGERDAIKDPALLELIAMADVVSPWNIGRFATPEQAAQHVEDTGKADIDWCRKNDLSFLPVVFPGFSWTNLSKQRGKDVPLNQIPDSVAVSFGNKSPLIMKPVPPCFTWPCLMNLMKEPPFSKSARIHPREQVPLSPKKMCPVITTSASLAKQVPCFVAHQSKHAREFPFRERTGYCRSFL